MFAKRVQDIKPFFVMEILQKAKEMEDKGINVIHLEVGEPDFNTPFPIVESIERFVKKEKMGYTHSLGVPILREAVCEHYKKRYGVFVEPSQVVITNGTSPAFLMVLALLVERGDKVIISDPHYPCYPSFVQFVEGYPEFVAVSEESGFQYDPTEIKNKISKDTIGIFINSPSNPTGTLISEDVLKEIAELGLWIFSDEIYHGLSYGKEKYHSALEFTDKCVVFNGFSKLYAMTGWRLGYMIVPKKFVSKLEAMVQNFFISPNSISQWAGYVALTNKDVEEEVKKMVETYNLRRKFMLNRLKSMGFDIKIEPKGAFYVFVNAKKFMDNRTSYEFVMDILNSAHVAVTPGSDFGSQGEGFVRFSYANSIENISNALDRIEKILRI